MIETKLGTMSAKIGGNYTDIGMIVGAEPEAYIKSVTIDQNKLTFVDKNDVPIEFEAALTREHIGIKTITQEEYDLLDIPDDDTTLYIIVGDMT